MRRGMKSIPLVLAVCLALPTLTVGLALDDATQRASLHQGRAARWDLFNFAPGDAQKLEPAVTSGPFPWFTSPELKLHFFRPLSSLLVWADDAMGAPWLAHLHSMVWFVLCVAVAMALFRRVLGAHWFLATLIFTVDDSHALATAWLANRNALVAAVFGMFALWLHLRWREDGDGRARLGSWAAWLLALTAGELSVGLLGFLVAYELLGRQEPLSERWRALWGPGALVGLYAVLWHAVGAGTAHSGTYLDPVRDPEHFAREAMPRLLTLFAGWAGGIPLDLAQFLWLRPIFVVLGAGLALLWWRITRAYRPFHEAPALRWLLPGALLATVPSLSTAPADRLLFPASYGLAALVAVVASGAARATGWRSKAMLVVLALGFGAQPLLNWGLTIRGWSFWSSRGTELITRLELHPDERVLVLTCPDFFVGTYALDVRSEAGLANPRAWLPLSIAPHDVRLERTSDGSFTLTTLGGTALETTYEQNLTSARFQPGETVSLDGVRVVVERVADGRPVQVEVQLLEPGARYRFLAWTHDGLVDVGLPPVGASLDLPRAPLLFEQALVGDLAAPRAPPPVLVPSGATSAR